MPAFTPATLDAILDDRSPIIYRDRGGLFAEIDPRALRKARTKAGMTQQQLADAIGITKKSVYEHETRPMRAHYETVKRLEELLSETISISFENSPIEGRRHSARVSSFEKCVGSHLRRIGFATSFVGQSPFNIIAEERVLIVSDAERSPRRIERKAEQLEDFADVSNRPIVVISEAEPRTNLPSITVAELENLSARALRKLARK